MTDTHIGSRMKPDTLAAAEKARQVAFFATGVKPRAIDVRVEQEYPYVCNVCDPHLVFERFEHYIHHKCTSSKPTHEAKSTFAGVIEN